MQQWIKEVARGKKGAKDLSYQETKEVANIIVSNQATSAQIAAYLVGARIKMESSEELLAFIHTLTQHAEHLPLPEEVQRRTIDFAGPYNGRHSFAATIPVSLLLAEQGVPVFIAASDTLPPKYGTSLKAIFHELGIATNSDSQTAAAQMLNHQFGFADTEQYCSVLARLRSLREEIGVRTLFNTVEKLVNISGARNIMLGAFHRTAINKLSDVFAQLDYQHAYVVQGLEGSEDVPVHRNSFVFDWTPEGLQSFIVKPQEYGLASKDFDKEHKHSAIEQAAIIQAIFHGENKDSYYYNQVLLNAGLRYYLFGVLPSIEEGISLAEEQIRSGRALRQLTTVQESNGN
ncbi:anthranilate phosphoribosyltransferase [Gracilibacillus alcaliphilus]|uniref:anthranilate phosphoribosyltransferase n=1 Tax=Gracilibacillus alcaliphilus TaxID=1401441 RepID=UPI00195BF92C|nr:anthranilate phosphoribosyltransferase [Gracilibacillus alcaliphilus]MBM7675825.1 anthranilate phosphoribosyltransferase [Gracilibacillus alcaliphilus]